MNRTDIFYPFEFGETEKKALDRDGHFFLPGILTSETCKQLTRSLARIQPLRESTDPQLRHHSGHAAEYDSYLTSLIAHPQMLELIHKVLGSDIRFDHCSTINRPPGHGGFGWHSHAYADDQPELGLVRIFFYVNGFSTDDAPLKVVPGSHHYRDPAIDGRTDQELRSGWLNGKKHPVTGKPLEIEVLEAPKGTAILMWTHAAHAVNARKLDSPTRWTIVYGYRNPGVESPARNITTEFEQNPYPGTEQLVSLY